MNITKTLFTALASSAAVLAFTAAPAAHAAGPLVLQVKAPAAATAIDIDNPKLNGKPAAKLIVTQLWVTAGPGVYNDHPIGVRYDTTKAKWQIVNEDGVQIPKDARFNVVAVPAAKRILATPLNSYFDRTYFPLQAKNDKALLLATHVRNPFPKVGDVDQKGFFGLFFIPSSSPKPVGSNWSIYNEDLSAPLATAYNVWDVTKDGGKTPKSFVFSSAVANISSNYATITNPLTDGKPDVVLSISHVYTATNPTLLPRAVGVWYNTGTSKWTIFNQNNAVNFTAGLDFVVNVQPAVTP